MTGVPFTDEIADKERVEAFAQYNAEIKRSWELHTKATLERYHTDTIEGDNVKRLAIAWKSYCERLIEIKCEFIKRRKAARKKVRTT